MLKITKEVGMVEVFVKNRRKWVSVYSLDSRSLLTETFQNCTRGVTSVKIKTLLDTPSFRDTKGCSSTNYSERASD